MLLGKETHSTVSIWANVLQKAIIIIIRIKTIIKKKIKRTTRTSGKTGIRRR